MTYSITNATLYAPNLVSIGSWGMAQSSLASTNGFGFSALDLPNLQDADYHCFKNQRALKEINIPYCHFVGGGSQSHFTDCRELVSVSNKWGYNGTFMSCYKLKDIDFIIRNVYDGFAYCSSLESVSYGGSSAIQYRSAFYGCSKLERIDVLGISIPLSYKDCFYNTPMSNSTYTGNWGSIYVPSSRVAWYKASTNWITYSDRITALPSEYDTRFVYAGEFSSSTITAIPSEKFNVEEILAYGFYQANSIAGALSFPNCERIDAYAFYASTSCSTITGLSFPSCKVIDNGVFQQRRFDFSVVEFPECVRLGIFAFSGCRFLLTGNNSSVYFNFPKLKYLDGWSTFTLYYGASSYYTPWMHFSFPELEVMRTSSQFAWSVKSLYAPKLKYCIGSQSYATFSGFRTNLWCDSLDLPELRLIEGDIMTAISSPLSQISLPKCYKIAGMISTARSLTSLYAPNLLVLGGLYDLPLLSGELDFSKLETIDTIYGVGVEKVKLLKPSTMVSFYSCSKLKKVYLGSLDQFTGNAFANCPLLEAVYFEHKHVVDLGQAFGNTSCSIYVPAELLSEYQASPQWSNVSNNFVGLTDEQFQAVLSNW